MGSVSDYLSDPFLDRAIDQLDEEKSVGVALLAFAKTIIDRPENTDKYSNSYAGHAAQLQINCTLNELQLWCSRIWDKTGHSLPMVAKKLRPRAGDIRCARLQAHPDWPHSALGLDNLDKDVAAWCSEIDTTLDSSLVLRLRERRNETFAHLLRGVSADRRHREQRGLEEGYTWNEVLPHVERTSELISRLTLIWQFKSHDISETEEIYRKYCEGYWEMLPTFSEVERGKP